MVGKGLFQGGRNGREGHIGISMEKWLHVICKKRPPKKGGGNWV